MSPPISASHGNRFTRVGRLALRPFGLDLPLVDLREDVDQLCVLDEHPHVPGDLDRALQAGLHRVGLVGDDAFEEAPRKFEDELEVLARWLLWELLIAVALAIVEDDGAA